MKLEELCKATHSKAVVLIRNDGNVVDSFYEKESFNAENFSAISTILIKMIDTFFTGVLGVKSSNEIFVKSDEHVFYIVKCDPEHVLCVLTHGKINTGLISLSIKKILKK